MKKYTLELDPSPMQPFSEKCVYALNKLATDKEVAFVIFTFGGVELRVTRSSTLRSLERQYKRYLKSLP